MPRGDGKQFGEPRKNVRRTDAPQYIPKALASRQAEFTEKQGFKRPGSQRKGNSN